MTDTRRVSRKELTSKEIVRELEAGNRVVIELEVLGATMRMAIREREGTYYCDTPVKLLTFESREELRICLERYRLARPDSASPEGESEGRENRG